MSEPITIIADLWQSYERDFVPVTAGPNQRRETQIAFYSGASGLFSSLFGAVKTLSDKEIYDGLRRELAAFIETLD